MDWFDGDSEEEESNGYLQETRADDVEDLAPPPELAIKLVDCYWEYFGIPTYVQRSHVIIVFDVPEMPAASVDNASELADEIRCEDDLNRTVSNIPWLTHGSGQEVNLGYVPGSQPSTSRRCRKSSA